MTLPRVDQLHPTARAGLDREALASLYGRPGADSAGAPGRAPWVRANLVTTLDGSATGPDGRSESISTPSDMLVFGVLRRLTDAIVIGAGTALAEPTYAGALLSETSRAWRAAHGLAEVPALVVVSATRTAADFDRFEREPVVVGGIQDLLALAAEHRWSELLVEGGPTLLAALAAAGALDELCLTIVPRILGGDGPRIAAGTAADIGLRLAHVLLGDGGEVILRHVRAEGD